MSGKLTGHPVDSDGNWEKQTPLTIRCYDRDWGPDRDLRGHAGDDGHGTRAGPAIVAIGDRPVPARTDGYFTA